MKVQNWKLCLTIAGLVSVLYFILSPVEPAMASDEINRLPTRAAQSQLPFQIEMFHGEHLNIPNKIIAAKIDYYNDPTQLDGVALQNAIITVLVPKSSYFDKEQSGLFTDGALNPNGGDWVCDGDGAEGDSCHFAMGSIPAGQSGSVRFAAMMYRSDSVPDILVERISMAASLHADNMSTSVADLFQGDVMLGTSAPTHLELAEEPSDFQIFLPVVISW